MITFNVTLKRTVPFTRDEGLSVHSTASCRLTAVSHRVLKKARTCLDLSCLREGRGRVPGLKPHTRNVDRWDRCRLDVCAYTSLSEQVPRFLDFPNMVLGDSNQFSERPIFRRGRSPTAPSRNQAETEKPRLVCILVLNNRDALEPDAASEGALQEIGKNQRCSHRTCGRRTFPITATKALSARCGWENCADIDSAGGHCAHCTLDDAHSVVSTGSVAQIG